MAKNLKFYFDQQGVPRARGPQTERLLMAFLETDVQGDDHICHDLMEDITAVEEGAVESREFSGNTHTVTIEMDGIKIESRSEHKPAAPSSEKQPDQPPDASSGERAELYETGLKHFREILEDWEAFILDDQAL